MKKVERSQIIIFLLCSFGSAHIKKRNDAVVLRLYCLIINQLFKRHAAQVVENKIIQFGP